MDKKSGSVHLTPVLKVFTFKPVLAPITFGKEGVVDTTKSNNVNFEEEKKKGPVAYYQKKSKKKKGPIEVSQLIRRK
jgi:hypothetical protein